MTDNTAISDKPAAKSPRTGWKQDPASVKADILQVATAEIATHGLSGSRVNVIAEKSKTSKRMIYYYFGDKEGLYQAVLEAAYRSIRDGEMHLKLDNLPPIEALEKLVDFTFRHHHRNPDFIRIIMNENIQHGKYLKHSAAIKQVNATAVRRIESIYQRGLSAGYFRQGINPLELHWFISAFSFFNVSNQATFSYLFWDSLDNPDSQERLVQHCKQMVLRFVLKPEQTCS